MPPEPACALPAACRGAANRPLGRMCVSSLQSGINSRQAAQQVAWETHGPHMLHSSSVLTSGGWALPSGQRDREGTWPQLGTWAQRSLFPEGLAPWTCWGCLRSETRHSQHSSQKQVKRSCASSQPSNFARRKQQSLYLKPAWAWHPYPLQSPWLRQ